MPTTHPRVRFLFSNVQGTDPDRDVVATIRELADLADVLSLCEVPNETVLREALPNDEWDWFHHSELAVAWRRQQYRPLHHVVTRIKHLPRRLVTPWRWILSVDLEPRHSRERHFHFTAQASHTVHHVERGGRFHNYGGKYRAQVLKAKIGYRNIATQILLGRRRTGRVMGGADLNFDLHADRRQRDPAGPYAQLTHRAGATVYDPGRGTDAGRMIDWLWSRGQLRAVGDTHIGPPTKSDHRAVTTTFELLP